MNGFILGIRTHSCRLKNSRQVSRFRAQERAGHLELSDPAVSAAIVLRAVDLFFFVGVRGLGFFKLAKFIRRF